MVVVEIIEDIFETDVADAVVLQADVRADDDLFDRQVQLGVEGRGAIQPFGGHFLHGGEVAVFLAGHLKVGILFQLEAETSGRIRNGRFLAAFGSIVQLDRHPRHRLLVVLGQGLSIQSETGVVVQQFDEELFLRIEAGRVDDLQVGFDAVLHPTDPVYCIVGEVELKAAVFLGGRVKFLSGGRVEQRHVDHRQGNARFQVDDQSVEEEVLAPALEVEQIVGAVGSVPV